MKYAPDTYARAFWETLSAQAGKPEPKQFVEVVAKNGDFSRIDRIVAAIEKHAVHAQGGRMVELEFARSSAVSQKFKFSAKDRVHTSINSSLVAGVRVTIDGERELDLSLQRKLQKLFPRN